jgi:hypothetical protein
MLAVPKKAQFCPSVDHEVLDIARRVGRAQATLVTFRPARASNDSKRGNTRQCVTVESSGGDAASLRRTNTLRTLGQSLRRRPLIFVVGFITRDIRFRTALFERRQDRREIGEKGVPELLEETSAKVFIPGRKPETVDGLEAELALQSERPLNDNLPVTKGRVREKLRLRSLLEFKEGAADPLNVVS